MGPRDTRAVDTTAEYAAMPATSYETRELAWELAQPRMDVGRIRFLVDMGAVPVDAARLAGLDVEVIARHPQLRGLRLFDGDVRTA